MVLLPNSRLVMLLRGPRVLSSTPQPVLGHSARRSQTHTLPALGWHPQGLSSQSGDGSFLGLLTRASSVLY